MPLKSDMLVKFPTGHWRVDRFGRWYPNIQGGDGPEDDETDDDTDDDEGSQPERTFTQADLKRIATKERREGKKAANREIMERFQFGSLDEAEEFIKSARERSEKTDDDAEKRSKRTEERERKAEEREQKANRKVNTAEVVTFLIDEGLSRKEARKAALLVELDFDAEDLEEDEIAEAITTLKEEMPRLFATVTEEDEDEVPRKRRTPDSTPRGQKPKKTVGSDMQERGRSRLQERHGDKLKSA